MTLDEIGQVVRRLYRDPNPEMVRAVLTDALAELGKTWRDWLVESGTLTRLAECMALDGCEDIAAALDPANSAQRLAEHQAWRALQQIPPAEIAPSTPTFAELAAIFGLPPLQLEIGCAPFLDELGLSNVEQLREFQERILLEMQPSSELVRWRPPLAAVAEVFLKSVASRADLDRLALGDLIRVHYPERGRVWEYRMRWGEGEWLVIPLKLVLKRYLNALREIKWSAPEHRKRIAVLEQPGDFEALELERFGHLHSTRNAEIAATVGCSVEFVLGTWQAFAEYRATTRLVGWPPPSRDVPRRPGE